MSENGTEGRVPFGEYSTWYHLTGDSEEVPALLVLHGGPGSTSEALSPYDELAATGRRVLRHDQLGCGRSSLRDVPHDPKMWSFELFMSEIDNLREHFGLDELHLLGQSWGGQLAMEYALSGASGIVSLTIQSSLASIEEWESEAMRLVAEMPEEMQVAVAAHERGESHPGFAPAMQEFERRHIMRVEDPPECWRVHTELVASDTEVYEFIVGDSELGPRPDGLLAGWDIRSRLGEIAPPTMLLSGRYDCSTPKIMQTLHDGISQSEWHLLESSSHCCQLEETARTLVLVSDFLARTDAARA